MTANRMGFVSAFQGEVRLATGPLAEVAVAVRDAALEDPASLLVFDDATGRVVDLDLRGSPAELAARYAPGPRGRGRPSLGVTAREVTLLPRHWEWLAAQKGGASAALRRLVEAARRADGGETDRRAARDAACRFMSAMAGDRPGFEEATRALYAGDRAAFGAQIAGWPDDVRDHAARLADAGEDGTGEIGPATRTPRGANADVPEP